jgi:protoheme IX farnesyltransferase
LSSKIIPAEEIELSVPPAAARVSPRARASDYLELTKPRITSFVLLTMAAGFFLGTDGPFDLVTFLHTVFAVALLSSGVSTLNQYFERDLDALMRRTEARPLPAGRVRPAAALAFGLLLLALGAVVLLAKALAPFIQAGVSAAGAPEKRKPS